MHTLALAVTFAVAGAVATPLAAQEQIEVQFPPGQFGTMIEGSVAGQEYVDYTLRAGEGQVLFAELDVVGGTGNGTAYFNVLPPGSDGEAIHIGHMAIDNTALVTLPEDGAYTIRVYLMGNDADTGKTADFTLDLSIQ